MSRRHNSRSRATYLAERWWKAQERYEKIMAVVRENDERMPKPRQLTVQVRDEDGKVIATKKVWLTRSADGRRLRIHVYGDGRLIGRSEKPGPVPKGRYKRPLSDIARQFGIHQGTLSRIISSARVEDLPEPAVVEKQPRPVVFLPARKQADKASLELVEQAIAAHFQMDVEKLKSKTNVPSVVVPRQICMYLCKKVVGVSLQNLGREFGGRHHTTVLHAVNRIEDLLRSDREIRAVVDRFTTQLEGVGQ